MMVKYILSSLAACLLLTEAAVLPTSQDNVVAHKINLAKPILPLYKQALEAQPGDLSGIGKSEAGNVHVHRRDTSTDKVNDGSAEGIQDPTYNPACNTYSSTGQDCGVNAYHVCNMTEVGQWGCGRANITGYDRVNIVPGGETKCLNSSMEYFFQVMQGDPTKLFLWFQGGGACWSNNISAPGACASYPGGPDFTEFVQANPVTYTGGFFNRTKSNDDDGDDDDASHVDTDSDQDAPFNDFTIIQLPYCSGDLFVGDTIRTYLNETTGEFIAEAHQTGSTNTETVLSWVFANYPNITKLVVGGCSAGSLAAQMWSGYIYESYKNMTGDNMPKMAVIPDGYAGIFPDIQRELMREYNTTVGAWATVLPDEYIQKIVEGKLFFCEVTNYMQDMMPNTTYAAPMGGHDEVQLKYFNAIASVSNKSYVHDDSTPQCAKESVPVFTGTSMDQPFFLNSTEFFKVTEDMYEGYMNTGADNFYPYFVNTTQHCFLPRTNIKEIVVVDFITGRNITLIDWLDDITGLESDVDDTDDVNDDFYRVCDQALPCDPMIFNSSIVPKDD